ncbi:MAG: DUF4336 domain-containing protein [Cyanobacteria bacterium J06554_11]
MGQLEQLDEDIWVASQPLSYFGLSIGTRMTVIRQQNQKLTLISPITLSDRTTQTLAQLGEVENIIAPNLYHYFFAGAAKARYPSATLWGAPGLAEKEPDLPIDRTLARDRTSYFADLDYLFFDGFKTLTPKGSDPLNECVFFHANSRTLILTDTAFYLDETLPLLVQFTARVLGNNYKKLSPSRLEKIATRDKAALRKTVEKVLQWDFERVIVAHGSVVEHGGKEKFAAGYRQFFA